MVGEIYGQKGGKGEKNVVKINTKREVKLGEGYLRMLNLF